MTLALPHPSLGTGVVDPTPIEENFTEIVSKINGNIDNSDIKVGAAIDIDKCNAQYEWMVVTLSGSIAAGGYKNFTPIYNDGKGNWTVAAVQWATSDVGGKTATFAIEYGYYNDEGTWVSSAACTTTAVTGPAGVADNEGYQGSATLNTLTVVTPSTSPIKSLALRCVAADAAATLDLSVSVMLKRKITGA